ncbi:DUF1800 family protein, partial [Undibacterium luofuense]|uniref:DUF1800 family protein n=1 Tax=Undibacterium luofuense TaxID=2828733 RepID=UPI0030EB2677
MLLTRQADGTWRVPSYFDFPADFAKLSGFVGSLTDTKLQRLVTSNPSPGYICRVAQVFNDNGKGVRGDIAAVTRAILMDYEARSGAVAASASFGKPREPLLRATSV